MWLIEGLLANKQMPDASFSASQNLSSLEISSQQVKFYSEFYFKGITLIKPAFLGLILHNQGKRRVLPIVALHIIITFP